MKEDLEDIILKYASDGMKKRISEIDDIEIPNLIAERDKLKSILDKGVTQTVPKKTNTQTPAPSIESTSWWARSYNVLLESKRPLSTSEIVNMIMSKYEGIDRKTAVRSVSSILGLKVKAKKLKSIKEEGKDQKFDLI